MFAIARRRRPLAVAALALSSLLAVPFALAAEPTTAPAATPGFSEALPLMRPGAAKPTTKPADLDAELLKDVTLPGPPQTDRADDPSISAAATAYRKIFDNAREAGERPMQADMGDYVDRVLATWDLSKLSLGQLGRLISSTPLIYAPKSSAVIDAQLAQIAKQPDADGAQAAIIRLQLLPFNAPAATRAARVKEVLAQPALREAFAKGAGAPLLSAAAALEASYLKSTAGAFNDLAKGVTGDAPLPFFDTAASFQLAVAHALTPDDVKAFEPFRSSVAAAAAVKLSGEAGTLNETSKERLTRSIAQLNGAFARGELIGHPAPPIEFIAFNDPTDPTKKIASLADLKGKVVVLDFWATWCGPCVASFPKVKALSRYYRGFDVVVVGVTSPQGYVVLKGSRVDTSDDVNKEVQLTTTDFRQDKDMTWPIAVSKTNVFNPEYGITGIPSVVIIDANGVVRHAGLHPASELDEKVALIDPLLAEAKLPLPARMMMSKPNAGGQ